MPSAICPYLGLIDDPDTCLAFPTERNSCQRTVPAEIISLEHQGSYCLTYKYTQCPIYMGESGSAINADRARARRSKFLRRGCITIWLTVVLVGIAALIPFLSNYQGSGISQSPDLNSQNVVLELAEPVASTPTQVLPSPTLTQVIPTLEPSPTPCFPPAGWVPYVLTSADDVGNLAKAVGLSLEDLQRANCGANLSAALPGDAIFLPYIPTSTPDPLQLLTPTNTLVSIIIINTSTPTPTLTPVPTVAPPFVPPTATKPPKNNPPPSRPSPTPPESRP
jgi:hypothetical protein